MKRHNFSWFLILFATLALGATSACVKNIPLPPTERDALTAAVTEAVNGTMDIITIEQISISRTPAYLRVALKVLPDKVPQSKASLRAHIQHTSMDVMRRIAQNSTLAGVDSMMVEYFVSSLAPGQQPKGPDRIRMFYNTGVSVKSLKKHDVSTITNDQIASIVTHTLDDIRKLDLPN